MPDLPVAPRRALHAEFIPLVETLVAEHQGVIPAGTVIRHVVVAREEVLRAAIRGDLKDSIERAARARLSAWATAVTP